MNTFRMNAGRVTSAVPAFAFLGLVCVCSAFSAASHAESAYRSIHIIEPEQDQVIERPGEFSVIADTEPNLQAGHRVQLFLDGEAHRIPNTEGRFTVPSAASGQHTLQVKIIDQGAGVLTSSAVRTITVE